MDFQLLTIVEWLTDGPDHFDSYHCRTWTLPGEIDYDVAQCSKTIQPHTGVGLKEMPPCLMDSRQP